MTKLNPNVPISPSADALPPLPPLGTLLRADLGRAETGVPVASPERAGRGAADAFEMELIGASPSIEAVRRSIEAVAPYPRTVVVTGETGTGKEIVARLLHRRSGRPGPFVAVNCGGFTEGLLASELFGHVRGAFTGAVHDQPGLFRAARGGTLLLDEAGDLPLPLQATLLRVLETWEVRPVGSVRDVAVDVRVIAASNRELGTLVQQGLFRADLYGRLAQWTIRLPPLRDRRDDIPQLTRVLLARMGSPGRLLTPELEEALLEHPWPLNVRGLLNVLAVASIATTPYRSGSAPTCARRCRTTGSTLPSLPRSPRWSSTGRPSRSSSGASAAGWPSWPATSGSRGPSSTGCSGRPASIRPRSGASEPAPGPGSSPRRRHVDPPFENVRRASAAPDRRSRVPRSRRVNSPDVTSGAAADAGTLPNGRAPRHVAGKTSPLPAACPRRSSAEVGGTTGRPSGRESPSTPLQGSVHMTRILKTLFAAALLGQVAPTFGDDPAAAGAKKAGEAAVEASAKADKAGDQAAAAGVKADQASDQAAEAGVKADKASEQAATAGAKAEKAGDEAQRAANADEKYAKHDPEGVKQARKARSEMEKADPGLAKLFDRAAGYAMFATVGKGGAGVGGAHGTGVLFEKDMATGKVSLTQVTVGLQLGGQAYSEVVFFENDKALKNFKKGDYALAAQASAVVVKSGASANAKYVDGVSVFTHAKGGVMAEASVGGQKFGYQAYEKAVAIK